jgi:hypothetical protein
LSAYLQGSSHFRWIRVNYSNPGGARYQQNFQHQLSQHARANNQDRSGEIFLAKLCQSLEDAGQRLQPHSSFRGEPIQVDQLICRYKSVFGISAILCVPKAFEFLAQLRLTVATLHTLATKARRSHTAKLAYPARIHFQSNSLYHAYQLMTEHPRRAHCKMSRYDMAVCSAQSRQTDPQENLALSRLGDRQIY